MKQHTNKPKSPESEAKSEKIAKFFSSIIMDAQKQIEILKFKLHDLTKTNLELGIHHLHNGYYSDAIIRLRLLLAVKKEIPEAYYYLGICCLLAERKKEAEENFRKALGLKPDFEECKYMLAKFDSNFVPTKISTEFVELYLNEHAWEYYDKFILEKEYVGAEQLLNPIIPDLKSLVRPLTILELGCGIGMSGDFIWRNSLDIAQYVGVDLSDKLLDIAAHLYDENNKQVYTKLEKQDLTQHLASNDQKFDLILAPGSFDYVSDLAETISAAKKHLVEGGILAFYVEQSGVQDRELDKTRMHFTYSRKFLEAELAKAGASSAQIQEIAIDANTKGWAVYVRG